MTDAERKDFIAHLEWASREVAAWPAWKRNALGGRRCVAHDLLFEAGQLVSPSNVGNPNKP
jgi:hypothetical protein